MFKLMQTALITQHSETVNILIAKLSEIPLFEVYLVQEYLEVYARQLQHIIRLAFAIQ